VLHHFQATTYQGLVYVIGALTGNFPNEPGVDHVYTYDPLADTWAQGPLFPPARKRGSAGVVEHNGIFYIIGGSTAGHAEGSKPWVDSWDPGTNTWTELPDMPNPRDHFFAVLVQDEIYCIGGRRSIGADDMVRETDVFDIPTQTWRTLPESAFMPITRAGLGIGLIGEEIFVFGGESGDDPGNIPVDDTQAFNVRTQTWRDVSLCPWPVHGSQAIVNNNALYLAAGSPVEGGGASDRLIAFYTGAVSDPVH
jgi:N-acetylneuraminic acid mutarotase